MRIFISSVQKEFAAERQALGEYLSSDPLLRRFFEPFFFERDIPASDRRPDAVYLDEVDKCDLYLGLFGEEYGREEGLKLLNDIKTLADQGIQLDEALEQVKGEG